MAASVAQVVNAVVVPAGHRRPSAAAMAAILAGLAGAWLAAGSVGLLGYPLRRGLALLAFGGVLLAGWFLQDRSVRRALLLLAAAAIAVAMLSARLPPVGALGAAVVLLASCPREAGPSRTAVLAAAQAVLLLAVYRLVYSSVAPAWYLADLFSRGFGGVAGWISGRTLCAGPTLAGMDFLVTTGFLAVAVPLGGGLHGGWPRAVLKASCALGVVLLYHLDYLEFLSVTPDLLLPFLEPPRVPELLPNFNVTRTWNETVRELVPWNLPVLAAVIHLLLAGAIFAWLTPGEEQPHSTENARRRPRWVFAALLAAAAVLAVALPVLTHWDGHRPSLLGKKIVMYEKGFLNWLKPAHGEYGRLSQGMYGMLPIFLESYGATPLISPELSEQDLRDADAVVLLYPNQPWKDGQLERIWQFVDNGGGLLVMGEHTICEKEGGSRFNDVLEPTSMQVAFDSATFAVGGWLQSYDALSHPTSAGFEDLENDFGVVIGASLQAHWPARPLLVGRFGWSDWGDEESPRAMMGNHLYDPGERLGDLVLAAEQPCGKGKIICFGDTSSLTNGITIGCHEYVCRLFAYLADGQGVAQSPWRQLLALLVAVLLAAAIFWRADACRLAAVAVLLGLTLVLCMNITSHLWRLLPDGRRKSPNNLAYVDVSHQNTFSRELWRDDGTMGLCLTLVRNGYLTLLLPELSADRLDRARVLVEVAPAAPFSVEEIETLRRFVRAGGILIYTVGYDRVGPSREVLSEFGFRVGEVSAPGSSREPPPLGHFKAPFFNGGDYLAHVRFYAAWPVECDDPQALRFAYHPPNYPVIIIRRYGKGLVAVVGDTCFAMNRNLEYESGAPFEGKRENADFWRWFLALLREGLGEGQPWYPPKPAAADEDTPRRHGGEKDEG